MDGGFHVGLGRDFVAGVVVVRSRDSDSDPRISQHFYADKRCGRTEMLDNQIYKSGWKRVRQKNQSVEIRTNHKVSGQPSIKRTALRRQAWTLAMG